MSEEKYTPVNTAFSNQSGKQDKIVISQSPAKCCCNVLKLIKLKYTNVSCVLGNTISNVAMIVPPILGAYLAYKDGLELRYIASHLALMSE